MISPARFVTKAKWSHCSGPASPTAVWEIPLCPVEQSVRDIQSSMVSSVPPPQRVACCTGNRAVSPVSCWWPPGLPELEKVIGLCETKRVNPCLQGKTENNTESPWCVARLATRRSVQFTNRRRKTSVESLHVLNLQLILNPNSKE